MHDSDSPALGVNELAALSRQRGHGFAPLDLDVNWYAAAALLCGIASARVVNLVGEIYLGELLLVQFALVLLMVGGMRPLVAIPVFGYFAQGAVLMLLGYMLSDIYRDALPAQFLRGWARIIVLAFDFIALTAIAAHDRRNLWWFVLGMSVAALAQLLVRGVPMMSPSGWKFGYSVPMMTLLACLSCLISMRLAAVAFAALGVWNIFMDFRILGAICVLVAAVVWMRSDTVATTRQQMLKLAGALLVAATLVSGALLVTHDEFAKRREQSNAGRSSVLEVAVWAISESPLIGYGSWPMDARLVQLYQKKMEEEGQLKRGEDRGTTFGTHSQVLQGWVEGGLLGVVFWVFYGYGLARCTLYVALTRPADGYMPMFLCILVYDLWHLFMSPFSSATRLSIALGVAIICACAAERHKAWAR